MWNSPSWSALEWLRADSSDTSSSTIFNVLQLLLPDLWGQLEPAEPVFGLETSQPQLKQDLGHHVTGLLDMTDSKGELWFGRGKLQLHLTILSSLAVSLFRSLVFSCDFLCEALWRNPSFGGCFGVVHLNAICSCLICLMTVMLSPVSPMTSVGPSGWSSHRWCTPLKARVSWHMTIYDRHKSPAFSLQGRYAKTNSH